MAKRKRSFEKKDRFTITINSAKGIRQLTLGQLAKRFFVSFALVLVLTLLTGGFVINYLYKEFTYLSQIKTQMDKQNRQARQDLQHLQGILEDKSHELAEVETKLSDIEMMVGIRPDHDQEITKRVDVAAISIAQKRFMLENIPSGAPLEKMHVTSSYGTRTHPVLKRKEFHTGIDLRGKTGTPVQATANGIVEYAGFHESSGFGNLLIIHHGFGFKSMYAHLSSIEVEPGDFIKKGDFVAKVGSTGLSSGAHLHYEIRYIQRTVNPRRFIDWSMTNFEPIFEKQRRINWDSLQKAAKSVMKTAQLSSQLEQKFEGK